MGLPKHQLMNDCITKWGSTYKMLKRFLEQLQTICAMLLEDGDNQALMPSTNEIATMEELVEILKHFYQATEILSGELQRYELKEPLDLENKQPLLWWKEHELLYNIKAYFPRGCCALLPLVFLVNDFSALLETWLLRKDVV